MAGEMGDRVWVSFFTAETLFLPQRRGGAEVFFTAETRRRRGFLPQRRGGAEVFLKQRSGGAAEGGVPCATSERTHVGFIRRRRCSR